ncbi:hypothetical protein [Paraburkholderia sp.]|jgi:hypothetical protein|uniref:hypothetical protein n=1 Tax=Paraburkholderia sp. TaxID=1926495 RepID=UPI002F4187E6
MLTQLTIHPAHGAHLAALCRALRDSDVRVSGQITQRGEHVVEVRIVTDGAPAVSSLCRLLVEAELAETVLVERLDVDDA